MGVVGSVVRGTDDGRSMGGGREVFVVRVRRVEGWEDSGRVEGSLEKVKCVTCHTVVLDHGRQELAWRLKSVLPVGFLQHQGCVFSGGVRR